MVAPSMVLVGLANIFVSQSLVAAIPNALGKVVARGGGFPASNPPGVTCYNTWETVTNDVCFELLCCPWFRTYSGH